MDTFCATKGKSTEGKCVNVPALRSCRCSSLGRGVPSETAHGFSLPNSQRTGQHIPPGQPFDHDCPSGIFPPIQPLARITASHRYAKRPSCPAHPPRPPLHVASPAARRVGLPMRIPRAEGRTCSSLARRIPSLRVAERPIRLVRMVERLAARWRARMPAVGRQRGVADGWRTVMRYVPAALSRPAAASSESALEPPDFINTRDEKQRKRGGRERRSHRVFHSTGPRVPPGCAPRRPPLPDRYRAVWRWLARGRRSSRGSRWRWCRVVRGGTACRGARARGTWRRWVGGGEGKAGGRHAA